MPISLSGSLVITGSITTTGVITMSGSIASASYSSNSDLLQGTGSVGFTTTASFNAVSSSQQQVSASLLVISASYATTGSNSFRANQSITGSLTVSSTITAQTLLVSTISSSITYSSGSNIFGNTTANTQTFTGSVNITGSQSIFGNVGTNYAAQSNIRSFIYDNSNTNYAFVAQQDGAGPIAQFSGNGGSSKMYISSSGNVGIGRTNAEFILDVNGDIAFNRTNKLMFAGPTVGDRSRSYFIGDGNNNIFVYGPSSNLIATFGYTGNVGIGLTNPGFTLDVTGSMRVTNILTTYCPSTANGTGLVIQATTTGAGGSQPGIQWNNNSGVGKFNIYYDVSSTSLQWGNTYGTTFMTLSQSGSLGMGITPNNWYTAYKNTIQLASGMAIWGYNGSYSNAHVSANYYSNNVGTDKYIGADYATDIYQNGGNIDFRVAGSGAADGTISWTNAMRITNTGTVGIGSTSPLGIFDVVGSSSSTRPTIYMTQSGYGQIAAQDKNHAIILRGYPTDYTNYSVTAGDVISFCEYGDDFRFYRKSDTNNMQVQVQFSGGVIYARNTTVQALSDIRTKENIRNSEEGLDIINALRPVRFDFKEEYSDGKKNQLGFIAQEVEEIFPDAVSEMKDNVEVEGRPLKTVGPGALIPVLVKAIQELSAKVTALETK